MDETGGHKSGERPIRLGVSHCLLGAPVRYDGGHKRDSFIADDLARMVEFVPLCPELGAGFGVPREPVRLVADGGEVRLRGVRGGADRTQALRAYCDETVRALRGRGLNGVILKQDSPSCGLSGVRLYGPDGIPSRDGTGLFAAALAEAFPDLPLTEEGRLADPPGRDAFLVRVFAHHRLDGFFSGRWEIGDLRAFHARERLLLMAHDPQACEFLGRLVAQVEAAGDDLGASYRAAGHDAKLRHHALGASYRAAFLAAVARPVS